MKIELGIVRVLGIAVLAAAASPVLAQQSAVTYVEGQAALAGRPLNVREGNTTPVAVGQMLATGQGTAELALTPGAQLRLDMASAVKLVAQDNNRTEVSVQKGRVEINLAGMREGGELQVDTPGGAQTLLIQNGLYEFDVKTGQLRVFDGKAAVQTQAAAGWVDVKGGHMLALNGAAKPVDFDRNVGDGFARREDAESARAYGYNGYGGGGYAGDAFTGGYGFDAVPYGFDGYPGYGLYGPAFYPGFYGGFGYYGGFGFGGGFGYPGVRGGRFRR